MSEGSVIYSYRLSELHISQVAQFSGVCSWICEGGGTWIKVDEELPKLYNKSQMKNGVFWDVTISSQRAPVASYS
jgi:hypothetical protein